MSLTNEDISIEVLLFARMVEQAGCNRIRLNVPQGIRIHELQERLLSMHPALEHLARVSRWAVNEEFVESDHAVESPASIALIPPVSGG